MNRKILAARIIAAAILALAAGLTAWPLEAIYAVKAPMLTIIGGAIVLVGLIEVRLNWENGIVVAGTTAAIGGSWYWYLDAAKGDREALAAVISTSVILVVIVLVFGTIAWFISQREPDEMERERRAVVRSLRRRLHDAVEECGRARPIGPGGQHYEQYDATIHMLFMQTSSMVNNPHQWTYAPKQHEDLIAWYVIERLRRIAEIAISKHPHQCRYGAVAYRMADLAEMYLYRINIITEFDPVPAVCPQCKEPKPTHKANCMAAICWRCKYPTPPRNPNSDNTAVITPQCYRDALCFARGEEVSPVSPIAPRIRLPFGLSQGGQDNHIAGPVWPRNRRALRQLLEELNHD